MDFEEHPDDLAFRLEARAWLAEHAPRRQEGEPSWSEHRPRTRGEDDFLVEQSRRWQETKHGAGWAGIAWPPESGGRGRSANQARIFSEEEARYETPAGLFMVAIDMAGPTIQQHGSEGQRRRHLEPTLRGEQIWCQLFSEPSAGSDLAALRTRAERDGDEWVINGQKVWTTSAHHADYGLLLARTDWDVPKHEGITYFLVPMDTPGVDVRPLRQIDGAAHFNEVFLTDVRLPDSQVLGEVHRGWGVAMTTLLAERTAIGGAGMVRFDDVLRLAERFDRRGDPVVRQHLAAAYARFQIQQWLAWRAQTAIERGRMPGPEASVLKLMGSNHVAANAELYQELSSSHGMLWQDDGFERGRWQGAFLYQWASRLGGGTDQVQRNVIGERVLGLPREPRADRDVPFRDLPSESRPA